MIEQYFQDELEYLKRSGKDFAHRFPGLSGFLGTQSTDPDVERLLEGFAFLTGKLRAKIDDQMPELTHMLIGLLWPHLLLPIPSLTILQLRPKPGIISAVTKLEKGIEVNSVVVGKTSCPFRTTSKVDILPFEVDAVDHRVSPARSLLSMRFKTLTGEPVQTTGLQKMPLFISTGDSTAQLILLWLQRHLTGVALIMDDGTRMPLPENAITRRGFERADAILPYPPNAFEGYRLLQEFYVFPQKFHFFDITIPQSLLRRLSGSALGLELNFDKPIPPEIKLDSNSFKLNCVPAINLFSHGADPIRLNKFQRDYRIRPMARSGSHIEIFSIDQVTGSAKQGSITPLNYPKFSSFNHELEHIQGRNVTYCHETRIQDIPGTAAQVRLSFFNEDMQKMRRESDTVSIDMTCMNGSLPETLAIGEIHVPSASTPDFINPRNVTRPTRSWHPVLDGSLHWKLISALSLSYNSLQDIKTLKLILVAFDFPAQLDRRRERVGKLRLDGIEKVTSQPIDLLLRGMPVRGTRTVLDVKQSNFASEGEMLLFLNILNNFFALYATVNSFHELGAFNKELGEEYTWPARIGVQCLI